MNETVDVFRKLHEEYENNVVSKLKEELENGCCKKIRVFLSADSIGYFFNTKLEDDGFDAEGIAYMNRIVINGKTWDIRIDSEVGTATFTVED